MTKALALYSGGLDSALAIRIIQEQGIDVVAAHFNSVFTSPGLPEAKEQFMRKAAAQFGVELILEDNSEEFLELIKHPRYGYGRNINPCIDCRIRNLRRGGEIMREIGADFMVTGEVLGQRPMSQNRGAMDLVVRRSGLEGLLVRPLCAKRLEPTLPEQKGWVDRERLLDLAGRSRKTQMALARSYGIETYSSPAGGCLVTDPGFTARMRELLEHDPDCGLNDVSLLKYGRHFRLSPRCKVVVGRDQSENDIIESIAREGDVLLEAATVPGPVTLVRGEASDAEVRQAAAITMRYGKAVRLERTEVRTWSPGAARDSGTRFETACADSATLDRLRISAPDCESPPAGKD